MEQILFIIIYFTVPIFVIFFLYINNINLMKPNIISVSILLYLAFAYIGILPLYFEWDAYRAAIGVTDKSIIFKVLIFSSISLVLLTITISLVLKLLPRITKSVKITSNITNNNLSQFQLTTLLLLLVISTIFFIIYLITIPDIPIFALIKGYSTLEIKQFRSMATNDFIGKLHYYTLFYDTFYQLICYTFFANYLIKKNRNSLILFIITFLLTSFAMIQTTAKAPLIWFLIGLTLVYLICSKKEIRFKSIIKLVGTSMVILFLFYKHFMGMQERTTLDIITSIFSRIFTGQVTPAYYYLEIFPEIKGYLHGKSFPNPGGIFPWEHYRITVEVMNMKFQHLAALDIVGSAPTVFWGEAYANLGIVGVFMSSIYMGFLIGLIHAIFLGSKKNAFNIGIYVVVIMEFKNLAISGISNYLFNITLMAIAFLWIVLNFVRFKSKAISK